MSAVTFTDLGASEIVVRTLAKAQITAPFAIQQKVIADAIAGRDVLAKSPTGSGKTLAFGIPLVQRVRAEAKRPAALVLAPTRELATQIVDDLREIAHARALRIAAVYGGVGIVKQAHEAANAHIIVATPGRLEDLLAREAFTLRNVQILVLDEADRMLDMGFKPAIDRIIGACPAQRQTMCFSATLDGDAGRLARRLVSNHVTHEHTPEHDLNAGEIEHRFVKIAQRDRLDALIDELDAERDLALVFVRTKHGADRLVKRLGSRGYAAVAMHGNKTQRQRERALAQFDAGDVDTLIATDVAARGIDIDRISHVINFDPPDGPETYTHRVGRTGRAGRDGIGITLVADDQRREIARMADDLGLEHELRGYETRPPAPQPQPQRHQPRPERPVTRSGSPARNHNGERKNGTARNGGESRGSAGTHRSRSKAAGEQGQRTNHSHAGQGANHAGQGGQRPARAGRAGQGSRRQSPRG